jgi:hypothetical protein
MDATLTILRWAMAVPIALVGSDFCGMLLSFLTWGIRHLGGKIFGDTIEILQKPFAIIDDFIIGILFVVIGVLIAPNHSMPVILGLVAVKVFVDYLRRLRSLGPDDSRWSTWGAVAAGLVLSAYFSQSG